MSGFGRIPIAMIAAGKMAGLSGTAAVVYMVLASHANREWCAWPGISLIARCARADTRTVERALQELERRQLIEKRKSGGGRGHRTVYLLRSNPGETTGVYETETPALNDTKPRQIDPETPVVSSPPIDGTALEQQQNRPPAVAAEAVKGDRSDVRAALVAAGVGEPKLTELAGRPGLSATIVAELARRAAKGTNPPGMLVSLILAESQVLAEKAREDAADQDRRQETAENRRLQHEAEKAKTNRERAATDKFYANLTRDEVERGRAMAVAERREKRDCKTAERWTTDNPEKNRPLKIAICRLLKAAESLEAVA